MTIEIAKIIIYALLAVIGVCAIVIVIQHFAIVNFIGQIRDLEDDMEPPEIVRSDNG